MAGGKSRKKAGQRLDDAAFTGGNFSGTGGIGAGFDFSDNSANVTTSLGDLGPMFQQLLQVSQGGLDQAQGGLPPELAALFSGAQGAIGGLGQGNQSNFQGLGDIFNSSLQTAQADPFALGAGVSDKLRQISERKNQRLVNNTFDRLKSSGKLGTTGGANIAGQLEQNLFDQGLQFDLAGLQAGQGLQQDAFGRVMGATQGREGIAGRGFSEGLQAIMSQVGIGQQGFQDLMQSQQQGANIGFGAGQQAGQLSQLPLAFLQAMQGIGTTSSNSLLGAASGFQANAELTQAASQANKQMGVDLIGGVAQGMTAGVSDVRLKEDIVKIGSLGDLNVYKWNWNDIAKSLGVNDPTIGVIAQEAREIYPEAVSVADNGYLQVDYSLVGA